MTHSDLALIPRPPLPRGILVRPSYTILDPEKVKPLVIQAIQDGKITLPAGTKPPSNCIDYAECRRIAACAIRNGSATVLPRETQVQLDAAKLEGAPLKKAPKPQKPKVKKERLCKGCKISLGVGGRMIYCDPCREEALKRRKGKSGGVKRKPEGCLFLVEMGKALGAREAKSSAGKMRFGPQKRKSS